MPEKSDRAKKGIVFMGMGFELVALILGGQYIGKVIDDHYGFGGLAQGGMIILLMVGWMYQLIVMLKRFMNEDEVKK